MAQGEITNIDFYGNRLAVIELPDGKRALLMVSAETSGDAPAATVAFGQNNDVDTGSEQLVVASTPCAEVLVQAATANTGVISVGDVNGQYFELKAGESLSLPVANVNLVYVKASVNNQVVNWVARS